MEIFIKCTLDRPQPAKRLVGAKQVTMWMNVDIVNALIILSDFVARPFIRCSTVRVTHANFPNLAPVCLLIIKQLRRLGPLLLLKYFQVFLLLLLCGPIVLLPLEQAINFTPSYQITSTASGMCSLHKLQRQIHKNR